MENALEKFRNYIFLRRDESYRFSSMTLVNTLEIIPSCTYTIDCILADTILPIGGIESLVRWIPNQESSDYKYYDNQDNSQRSWYKYVRLIKKRGQYSLNGHSQDYFVILYTRFTTEIALKFLSILFAINRPEMRITRFIQEYSSCTPNWDTINCGIPINSQQQVCKSIMRHWLSSGYFNTKVIISGPPGVGKLNVGRLLKRNIEFEQPNFKHKTFVELFEDVDLSLPGLDILSQIRNRASEKSPVIITVKNIDIYYKKVLLNTSDPVQTAHTDNKSTFNNMLDDIGNIKHVITIFTTNLTKGQLNNVNSESPSFFRPGRANLFITMTETNAEIEEFLV